MDVGGPRKRGKNKLTIAVKEAVEHAFNKVNGEGYLVWLSKENPSAFCSLVSKCIPQQVAVDVGITVIDLGSALAASRANLERLTQEIERKTIEHEAHQANAPDIIYSDTLSPTIMTNDHKS